MSQDTKNWSNELLTAADMNTYLSDPIDALAEPPFDAWTGGSFTPTALSAYEFVTGSTLTITPSRDGEVLVTGIAFGDAIYDTSYWLQVDLDGVKSDVAIVEGAGGGVLKPQLNFSWYATGLTADTTYTFKLYLQETGTVLKAVEFKQFAVKAVI